MAADLLFAAAALASIRSRPIDTFVPKDEIDERHIESLITSCRTKRAARTPLSIIRDAIQDKGKVALARIVMGHREHTIAIRPSSVTTKPTGAFAQSGRSRRHRHELGLFTKVTICLRDDYHGNENHRCGNYAERQADEAKAHWVRHALVSPTTESPARYRASFACQWMLAIQ